MKSEEFCLAGRNRHPYFSKEMLMALNDSITETEKDIYERNKKESVKSGCWPMLMDIRGDAVIWTLTRVH